MRKLLTALTTLATVAIAPMASGASEMPTLIGQKAPEISLPSDRGETIRLSEFQGKQNVLLAFFPKAFTPGCEKEMKALGQDLPKFKALETQVLGVSYDTPETMNKFAVHCAADFPFLTDEGGKIAEKYQAAGGLLMLKLPKRRTYLIDKQGVIRQIYDGMPDHARIFKDLEAL